MVTWILLTLPLWGLIPLGACFLIRRPAYSGLGGTRVFGGGDQ